MIFKRPLKKYSLLSYLTIYSQSGGCKVDWSPGEAVQQRIFASANITSQPWRWDVVVCNEIQIGHAQEKLFNLDSVWFALIPVVLRVSGAVSKAGPTPCVLA